MRDKHLAFWRESEIQQFWSGESFHRTDDGNLLSYDLARIIVEQLAKDWESFKQFVSLADRVDAGASAARVVYGLDLGLFVCTLLELSPQARKYLTLSTLQAPSGESRRARSGI